MVEELGLDKILNERFKICNFIHYVLSLLLNSKQFSDEERGLDKIMNGRF